MSIEKRLKNIEKVFGPDGNLEDSAYSVIPALVAALRVALDFGGPWDDKTIAEIEEALNGKAD